MQKILIIHTGGTITMQLHTGAGDEPIAGSFDMDVFDHQVPGLQHIAHIDSLTLFLEDSSNVTPTHWEKLAQCVNEHYEHYDGFVILHGTDTMAWTASALSFSFQNLGKPVVFTGSQVPLGNRRTDARRNLINAVELATLRLPEVCICFNDKVYRGNRATKISIGDFDAFASPNHPLLAEFGLRLTVHSSYRPRTGPFRMVTGFDTSVRLLTLFPGMDLSSAIPEQPETCRAMIIQAYGSGNLPSGAGHDLCKCLRRYIRNGGIAVITSQALYDEVDLDKYAGGRMARDAGAWSAGDMTTEATVTKIMYLLAQAHNEPRIREFFFGNLVGERTL